jgi:hypothetical protein
MNNKMITFDEFVETFKPINNPNNDWGGEYSAFETYGDDWEFVKSQPANLVWTELAGDGSVIVNGFHYVNRLQYFVATVPVPDDVAIEVIVSLDKECECVDKITEGILTYREDPKPDCKECEGSGYMSIYPDTREELVELFGEEYANAQY